MRILQFDVDNITYKAVRPEASIYEDLKNKDTVSVDDTLVIFVCVEKGDDDSIADKAMEDTEEFMKKLDRKKLVVYPFAHLSSDLAAPRDAMAIIDRMYKAVPENIEAYKAPFGWNKKLDLDVKAHPLAEQSRSYGAGIEKKIYNKARPTSINTAIVKKSSWAGLPENDHRTIGEKLDLYSFQEVSPAMVYWHPNGYVIYKELMKFMREKEDEYEYKEISTPIVANTALWHVSGHMDFYRKDMFIFDSGFGELGLKPMNCPSSILIYKSKTWSYRDLPFRTAIFDKLYRSELSGVVTGLFRVKELTQDDGHIFLKEDQIEDELTSFLRMVKEVYTTFDLRFNAKLSTMPSEHVGDESMWERATAALKNALEKNDVKYEIKEGEGAFYGPKIDFDVLDSLGRLWQCATVQVDYQMPLKFNLEYMNESGSTSIPVIIHRAVLGSLERFIGVMTEHYQGKFPTWLAPVQVRVISISEQTEKYANEIYKELRSNRIRTELDVGDKTLEYKIRDCTLQKIPYAIILGKKEEERNEITIRSRSGQQKRNVKIGEFIEQLKGEVTTRSNNLAF